MFFTEKAIEAMRKQSVSINIDSCDTCPHLDHSGSFTPGGAKPICGHHDAAYGRPGVKPEDWQKRRLKKGPDGKLIIPEWCPLRKGKPKVQRDPYEYKGVNYGPGLIS